MALTKTGKGKLKSKLVVDKETLKITAEKKLPLQEEKKEDEEEKEKDSDGDN